MPLAWRWMKETPKMELRFRKGREEDNCAYYARPIWKVRWWWRNEGEKEDAADWEEESQERRKERRKEGKKKESFSSRVPIPSATLCSVSGWTEKKKTPSKPQSSTPFPITLPSQESLHLTFRLPSFIYESPISTLEIISWEKVTLVFPGRKIIGLLLFCQAFHLPQPPLHLNHFLSFHFIFWQYAGITTRLNYFTSDVEMGRPDSLRPAINTLWGTCQTLSTKTS